MLEDGFLVYALRAEAAVTSMVGQRIFPITVPQDATLPAIAYQRVDSPRDMAHDGPSGLVWPRVQVTCIAARYETAKLLAREVRRALNGVQGTINGVAVGGVFVEDDLDGHGEASDVWTVRMDVIIYHTEEV